MPALTDKQEEDIKHSQMPCARELIIDLMARYLEIHKKHIVENEQKRLILYTDNADLLYGLPEYALTLGVLDIINDDEQVFFPNVGQIRKAAESHIVDFGKDFKDGEILI